jgi:ribonuclease HII
VVAAAVVLPPGLCLEEATDSKALTPRSRARVAERVRREALGVGIGASSPREIDERGIVTATRLALERALDHLPLRPDHVVVDGRPVAGMAWAHDAVIKGDYRVHCVACASVVAKECRDRLMLRLHDRYPAYGWDRNKGYGTLAHREALRAAGPTPHHRASFGGVDARA